MQIIANNLAVNYSKTGQGPMLVLLHDWQESSVAFAQLTPLLEQTFTVICIDLAGFGGSQLPTNTWGVKDYALQVRDALQKASVLQNDITVLVGVGFGGMIATYAIAKNILQPKKLVLLTCSGVGLSSSSARFLSKLATLFTKRAPDYSANNEVVDQNSVMVASKKKIDKTDILSSAEKVHLPTLILHAELDQQMPLMSSQMLQQCIIGSELRVVKNAQHDFYSSNPEPVATYIKNFARVSL